MAKRSKHRKRPNEKIWMPHVPEPEVETGEVLSEEARHAKETVDTLVRDLFGETIEPRAISEPEESGFPQEDEDVPSLAPRGKGASRTARDAIEQAFAAQLAELAREQGEEPAALEPVTLEPAASEEQEQPESELSFKEYIESSNRDFKLLLELGYENELGEAIGFERIRAYHERGMNGRLSSDKHSKRRTEEFEKQSDDMRFRRAYGRKKTRWMISLAVSAVMMVLLMVYERTGALWGPFNGENHPTSYILLAMQLLLLDAVLCYKPLLEGFLRMLRFSPVDYSPFSAVIAGTFIYHFVLLFLPHSSMFPPLYLSPAALCIVLICGVELLNAYREALAFDVVSARRQKFALLPRISVGSSAHGAKDCLLCGREEGDMLYAHPVGFVRNYFSNTKKHVEHHRSFGAQLLLIISLGVAFGLYALATGESAQGVACAAFGAMLLCAPVISLLLVSVPLFFAALLRLRGRGAIVGEVPLSECVSRNALVLPGEEIFALMEQENLHFAEGCDAHYTTVLLHALLSRVQSPLARVFGVEATSRINPSALTLECIAPEGVSATLSEGGRRILLGTTAFLRERGVEVNVRESEDAELAARLLCVALDGRFAASFLVRYALSADVERLVAELDREGLQTVVRSKDPCIRSEILHALLPRYAHALSVQRPTEREIELRTDRVDVTVVSLGSCKEAARTFITCKRTRRVALVGKFLQYLLFVAGALLSALFIFFGNAPSGMTVTTWMLSWCGVYAVFAGICLRPAADDI